MAQILSSGDFTLGPNNSVAIYDITGAEVNWGLPATINWSSKPRITRKELQLMSGFSYDMAFNHGWSGDMSIQRFDNSFDVYWDLLEKQVRAGLRYPTFTIIQTITETETGVITRITFSNALITYEDAGTFSNEEGVVQKVMFTAPKRDVTVN